MHVTEPVCHFRVMVNIAQFRTFNAIAARSFSQIRRDDWNEGNLTILVLRRYGYRLDGGYP